MAGSRQLINLLADMERTISSHVAEVALEVQGQLVENPPEGTPVDTGWASVNWWVRIGSPPTGNDGSVGDPSTRAGGQAAGIAAMASYSIRGGQSIWITNGVPYIGRLNAGSSKQSPAGFVEDAIQRVVTKYKRVVLS